MRQHRPHLRRHPNRLHLIRPLGFDISEKAVRRAGLDYWHMVDLTVYDNIDHFFSLASPARCVAGDDQSPKRLFPGTLFLRLLADVRQRDRRTARVARGKIPQPLHPHP